MNLRQNLTEALATGLDAAEWTIIGYPDIPVRPTQRTVALWASRIVPQPGLASVFQVEQTLEVLTPRQDIRQADDDLDGALFEVLAIIWAMPSISFQSAERTTTEDRTRHAWTITVHSLITATPED